MITFDEAVRLIEQTALPLGTERVPIARAAGGVLAAAVVAAVDSPPADCSSMDGYAVREADLPGPLHVIGESRPGSGYSGVVDRGACVRIFTGAPLPAGADRVAIQEEVRREGDAIVAHGPSGSPRYVRQRGGDFLVGQELVPAGQLLTPRALVAASAADCATVEVWRRPRMLVIATGDELAPPGEARARAGAIPDSVSPGVAALAEQWGADAFGTHLLPDDPATLERVAGDAIDRADLVVVTGGASVGEGDFARSMFAPHGLELIFSKVAMKPGKPVWLGRARGRMVMGLPGNPTSAMVTARLLLAPLVAGLAGRPYEAEWRSVLLRRPLPACGDRETFVRARDTPGGAEPLSNQDSGAQHALLAADLLLRMRPHQPEMTVGEKIEAISF